MEANPLLWRLAFHGLAEEQRIWALSNHLTEEGAKLEAEVKSLGGYKRLLTANWANEVVYKPEQNRGWESCPGTSSMVASSPRPFLRNSSFVVFVRLRGVLVAYGVYRPVTETKGRLVHVTLRPLYSFLEIKQSFGDVYAEGRLGGNKPRGFDALSAELFFPQSITGGNVNWRGTYIKRIEGAIERRSPISVLELNGKLCANRGAPFETRHSGFATTMMFDCTEDAADWTFTVREYIF